MGVESDLFWSHITFSLPFSPLSLYKATLYSISHTHTSLQSKRRMNTSTSECSSGCESGWTTYFDQLSNSTCPYTHNRQGKDHDRDQQDIEDDEDLSMVSDASSGPPHLHGGGPPPPLQQQRNQKTKTRETKLKNKKQHSLCLDDTASSSFLHFSQVTPTIKYFNLFQIKVFVLLKWNFAGQCSST